MDVTVNCIGVTVAGSAVDLGTYTYTNQRNGAVINTPSIAGWTANVASVMVGSPVVEKQHRKCHYHLHAQFLIETGKSPRVSR